jgi:hypothetical protein
MKRADREIAREQTTRKPKRTLTIDLDAGSPDADLGEKPRATRASNVVPMRRRSKGVNFPARDATALRAAPALQIRQKRCQEPFHC